MEAGAEVTEAAVAAKGGKQRRGGWIRCSKDRDRRGSGGSGGGYRPRY